MGARQPVHSARPRRVQSLSPRLFTELRCRAKQSITLEPTSPSCLTMPHQMLTSMHRWRSLGLAVALAAPLLWGPAVAAPGPLPCAVPADLSTLSGDWQAEAQAHVNGGVAPSFQRLQLQVGRDGRVRGQRDWAAVHTGLGAVQGHNRQGQPSLQAVEPLIGCIESRSCLVLLVETEDSGRVSGWLRHDARG